MLKRYTVVENNETIIYDTFTKTSPSVKRVILYKPLTEDLSKINVPSYQITKVVDLNDITESMILKSGSNFDGMMLPMYQAYLLYDEIAYSGKNKYGISCSAKYETTNVKLMSDFTFKLNQSTTFTSKEKTKEVRNELVTFNKKACKLIEYINGQASLIEYKDTNGELIKSVFKSPTIEITYEKLTNKEFPFSDFVFPMIDYKLSVFSSKSVKDMSNFKKESFQQRRILLPNSKFFTENLNMKYLDTAQYLIIDTVDKLKYVNDFILSKLPKDYVLSVDAETTGLKFYRHYNAPDKSKLVTISISWKENQSIIIPFRMQYEQNVPLDKAVELLKPILEEYPILCHNGAADVRFCIEDDIDLNLQEDTLLLNKVITPFSVKPSLFGSSQSLDDLVKRMLGYDMLDLEKYIFKPSGADFDFSVLNQDYMLAYGCPDTDLCRQLWAGLRPKLPKTREFMYRELVQFSKNIGRQCHYVGMGVDVDTILASKLDADEDTKALAESIYKATNTTPMTFKIHSGSADIKHYFLTEQKIPMDMVRHTKDGNISIDKVVLERIAEIPRTRSTIEIPTVVNTKGEVLKSSDKSKMELTQENLSKLEYPVALLLRTYHNYVKDITAYYNSILNNSYEGFHYPDFRAGNLNTWRTPAGIQTTKSSLKKVMGAPKIEGKKLGWVSVDFATEEVRLAANQSFDLEFINMMVHPEADVHTLVASSLFNKQPTEISKEDRGSAKSSNFGIIYGMRHYSLGQSIFKVDVLSEEQSEYAKRVHKLYCYKRSDMLKPLEEEKRFVTTYGWQENKFKAPMVYPQVINSDKFLSEVFNPNIKHPLEVEIDDEKRRENLRSLLNASGNYPIQSWAAVILMIVYNNLCNTIKEDGYDFDINLPLLVHDEVGAWFDMEKVHPYYMVKLFNDCMCLNFKWLNKPVAPLYIGVGFGLSWGKAKSDEAELPVKLQARMVKEFEEGKAPPLEEILEEGLYEHFLRRKKEYLLERASYMFAEEILHNKFEFYKCMYKLNQDLFLQKQLNEFWKIFDKSGNGLVLNIEKLAKLFCENPITEVGEPFEVTQDQQKPDDDVVEFFYIDYNIHDKVSVTDKTVVVDLNDRSIDIYNEVLNYFKSLESKEIFNFNKELIIKHKNKRIDTNIKLKGLPPNFNQVFEKLIRGEIKSIDIKTVKSIQDIDVYPIEYKDHKMILNIELLKEKYSDKMPEIIKIISTYQSDTGKTKVYFSDKDTGVKIHLSVSLQESIDILLRKKEV